MFLQMELVFFRTENRNGINFYHSLQNTGKFFAFSKDEACLALLVIQTNGTENFGRFGKTGKKVIPWNILPFSQKTSSGMNRSIWIFAGITGIQSFYLGEKQANWPDVVNTAKW